MSERERRILGRAGRAGGAVGILLGALFGVGLAGGGGAASAVGVLLGVSFGSVVAAGWMLLALGLDVAARDAPSLPRVLWTAGLAGLAILLSLLALAAGVTAAGPDA